MAVPGQQLCLDLPEVQCDGRPDSAVAEFAQRQHATERLRNLAWALGEQRAVADFEAYRRSLTMSDNSE
jgi:hypothetical protein